MTARDEYFLAAHHEKSAKYDLENAEVKAARAMEDLKIARKRMVDAKRASARAMAKWVSA